MSKNKGTSTTVPVITTDTKASYIQEEKNSFINQDRRWKNHIEKMALTDRQWNENWDFMTNRSEVSNYYNFYLN
jgi:hypothetical protein